MVIDCIRLVLKFFLPKNAPAFFSISLSVASFFTKCFVDAIYNLYRVCPSDFFSDSFQKNLRIKRIFSRKAIAPENIIAEKLGIFRRESTTNTSPHHLFHLDIFLTKWCNVFMFLIVDLHTKKINAPLRFKDIFLITACIIIFCF